MNNRKLAQVCAELTGKTMAQVDEALSRRRDLDVTDRIAIKHQLTATQVGTLQAGSRTTLQRLLDTLDLEEGETYTEAELDARLRQAGISDPQQRISCKLEAEALGLLATQRTADRVVDVAMERLEITGPITLEALETRLDKAGIGSLALRLAVRAECQQRGYLGRTRNIQAAAARGVPLVDARGRAITLKSRPE